MIPYSKILIADDHSIIRMGLKMNLQFMLGYTNIHEATTITDLMTRLSEEDYTHLILDVIFPDGTSLEVAPLIRKHHPDMSILIFSMQPQEVYAQAFQHCGISNYLNKNLEDEDIVTALERFMNNEMVAETSAKHNTINPFINFCAQELKVLHYYLNGNAEKAIANKLNVPATTVFNTIHDIHAKTTTGNLKELFGLVNLHKINF